MESRRIVSVPPGPRMRFKSPVSRSVTGNSSLGRIVAEGRTRQLQVATGGKYKYIILSKIVSFLKTEFLEFREKRPTLNQLLNYVNELRVSDGVNKWLAEEGLSHHPRICIVVPRNKQGQETRYGYQPPLAGRKVSSQANLLKTLMTMHTNGEGGLLKSLVEDSISIADRFITNLVNENKIISITRLDKRQVLFYKVPQVEQRDVDSRFVELWRKVDVCNKEMSHVKTYMKNRGLSVFDEDVLDNSARRKRKRTVDAGIKHVTVRPKRRRQSKRKVKDNIHVQDKLLTVEEIESLEN